MNINMQKKNLAIISTRPMECDDNYKESLSNFGISLIEMPLTKISPLKDYGKFDKIISNIDEFNHIIFISTNAVKFFLKRLNKNEVILPKNIELSCIGPTTKSMLEKEFNLPIYFPKEVYDSKHLLQHEIFNNIANKNILIIRGEGGRETLKDGLKLKKANIIYGECYLREYLSLNLKRINEYAQKYDQLFLLITSLESAKKFMNHDIRKNFSWLNSINFIVNHKKIMEELRLFSNVTSAKDISLDSINKIIMK